MVCCAEVVLLVELWDAQEGKEREVPTVQYIKAKSPFHAMKESPS